MKKLVLFVLALAVWILLVLPVRGNELLWQDIIIGIVVAVVVMALTREVPAQEMAKWIEPARYFWMVVYAVVLAYYILKANFDVVYRVLHPDMPIHPGIVRVKTTLKTDSAVTALANSITLTPGTLTVNVTDDGRMYIHWINVKTADDEEAAQMIIRRFEWFLKKIFE